MTDVASLANWPEQAALALALGLPLEGLATEPECTLELSAEQ